MANTLDTAKTRLALFTLSTIFNTAFISTIENEDIFNSINFGLAALITNSLFASSFCCPDPVEESLEDFFGDKLNRDGTLTSINTGKSRICLLWLAQLTSYAAIGTSWTSLGSNNTTDEVISGIESVVSFNFALVSLVFLASSFCCPQDSEKTFRKFFSRNPLLLGPGPEPEPARPNQMRQPLIGARPNAIEDDKPGENPFDRKATANTEYDLKEQPASTDQQQVNPPQTGDSKDSRNDLPVNNHHNGATAPSLSESKATVIGQGNGEGNDELPTPDEDDIENRRTAKQAL